MCGIYRDLKRVRVWVDIYVSSDMNFLCWATAVRSWPHAICRCGFLLFPAASRCVNMSLRFVVRLSPFLSHWTSLSLPLHTHMCHNQFCLPKHSTRQISVLYNCFNPKIKVTVFTGILDASLHVCLIYIQSILTPVSVS